MNHSTYGQLPLDALYKLLGSSIHEMLLFSRENPKDVSAFNTYKKQVQIILDVIEEKKKQRQDSLRVA